MKLIHKFTLLITLVALLSISCNNELEVNTNFEDVTVLYAILEANKDTNWVRVQRGYLGNEAASVSYNRPDSLYYPVNDIEVLLRELEPGSPRSEFDRTIRLEVDSTTFNLQPGTFTTKGHRLYRTPAGVKLDITKEYEAVVVRKDGSEAYARTPLIENAVINDPNSRNPDPDVRVFRDRVEWQGVSGAASHEVKVVYKFLEFDANTKQGVMDSVSFSVLNVSPANQSSRGRSVDTDIINRLAVSDLQVKPTVFRFFEEIRIEVWSVGEDLQTFMELNQPSGGVSQNKPAFPQVTNGTGIVSTRSKSSLNVPNINTALENRIVTSNRLCDLRFAVVRNQGRDTCICDGTGSFRCF